MHYLSSAWAQIWPNLVAGLFPSGAAVWAKITLARQAHRHHAELKRHISAQIGAGQDIQEHDSIHN